MKKQRSSSVLVRVAELGALWMVVLVSACGQKAGTLPRSIEIKKSDIIGGEETKSDQYQNVVALTVKNKGYYCSGTLIAPKVVLTAGHCVQGAPVSELGVYAGEGSETENVEGQVEVEKIMAHNDYKVNSRDDSDIGLVFLKQELPVAISPAQILTDYTILQNFRDKLYEKLTLVGFGRTLPDLSIETGGGKRQVEVPLIDVSRKEILVGSKAPLKGACKGDSGGPAFLEVGDQRFLVGVTSRAADRELCHSGKAYYGLTTTHICWIEKSTGLELGGKNLGCSLSKDKAEAMKLTTFQSACQLAGAGPMGITAEAMRRAVKAKSCQEAQEKLAVVRELDLTNRDLRELSLLAEFPQITTLKIEGNPLLEVSSLKGHPGIKDIYLDGTDLAEGGILILGLATNKKIHYRGSILMDMYLQKKDFYLKYFLKRGADVNWQDQDGHSVIFASMAMGDSEATQFFIDHGADVDVADATGDNLLFFAQKQEDFVKILNLSKDPAKLVKQMNSIGMTPLFRAISFGSLELVKHMVEDLGAEVEPNPENPMSSPRFFAMYIGQFEIWKYLMEKMTGEKITN